METQQVDINKIPRQMRRAAERKLKKIKIIPSHTRLTAQTGLGILLEIFDQSPLSREFKFCLPERKSHRSVGSYMLGLLMLAGHIRGVENLSSMNRVRNDGYLEELFYDEVAAVRTLADFLYDFESEHIEKLNRFLNNMAKAIFEQFHLQLPEGKAPKGFIVDMDSTYHTSYGEAVEGVADKPSFAKKIRDDFLFIPGKLAHGARTIVLRVNESTKEVLKKIEGWRFPGFDAARIFSTS